MSVDRERAKLITYVGVRIVLFGTLAVVSVLAIRHAFGLLQSGRPSVLTVKPLPSEAPSVGNQFIANGGLFQLDVAEQGKEIQLGEETLAVLKKLKIKDQDLLASGRLKLTALDKEGLAVMLPPTDGSDAVGFDVGGVPRYPNMQRWMSVEDVTGLYQTVFYGRAKLSATETLKWYAQQLPAQGWNLLQVVVPKVLDKENQPYLFANRGGQMILLQSSEGCQETCVMVLAMQL